LFKWHLNRVQAKSIVKKNMDKSYDFYHIIADHDMCGLYQFFGSNYFKKLISIYLIEYQWKIVDFCHKNRDFVKISAAIAIITLSYCFPLVPN